MTSEQVRAYQDRWAVVAAFQAAEQRAATPALRFQQLNAIWRMARGLGLPPPARQPEEVWARWAQLRRAYTGEAVSGPIRLPPVELLTLPGADMHTPAELEALLPALAAGQRLLALLDERGLIIGGVAASLLGQPRLTADVDLMMLLSTEDVPRVLAAAAQVNLTPRVSDPVEFARATRMVLLRHPASGVDVDIAFGFLPFEAEAVARSRILEVGPLALRLPTPEDLIIMKAVAHRPQDLTDIAAIITAQPHLDRERIRSWVGEFAQLLERPDLWTDIAPWLPN